MDAEHGYTMKVVSRRTGLSPHVLRVWERRYGAVEPMRTPTNRRIYSDADVDRLGMLRQATEAGHSIGRIAGLSPEDLKALVESDREYRQPGGPGGSAKTGDYEPYISASLDAVMNLDGQALEMELGRAVVDLDQPTLIDYMIPRLMERIGELWNSGGLRVADEHMATAIVRTLVGGISATQRPPQSAPRIVITTPVGQLHEIGALLAATAAAAKGWAVHYLGPNLPAYEIADAANRYDAHAVALSLVYPAADPLVGPELQRLRQGLRADVLMLFGGRSCPSYADAIQQVDGVVFDDLSSMRAQLQDPRLAHS